MITWLRCTKWAWQVHGNASWCPSLSPTHLLKWTPNPNDKEERFDKYGTYHPCQILTIQGTSPKWPYMSMMIKFIWFSFQGNETSKWLVFQNEVTTQLINGLIFHVQLWSCDEHKLGFRLKSDGILLFTFHKPLRIISW